MAAIVEYVKLGNEAGHAVRDQAAVAFGFDAGQRAKALEIAKGLEVLCFECCGEPHEYFKEGSVESAGYPIMTEQQCCGRPRPTVPQAIIEYIEKLKENENG